MEHHMAIEEDGSSFADGSSLLQDELGYDLE